MKKSDNRRGLGGTILSLVGGLGWGCVHTVDQLSIDNIVGPNPPGLEGSDFESRSKCKSTALDFNPDNEQEV